jgi:glycosyltransferase involved in cell wall biosynthesis
VWRVLLISDTYPPVVGGSEIEAQRVSAGLIRRGHSVQVLCAGGPPMPPVCNWTDPAGVPVRILTRRSRGRWKDMLFAIRVAWNIWRGRRRYDVIYFLMQGLHLAAGLPVAHFARKATVVKIAGSTVIPKMRQSRAGVWELNWLQKWDVPVMVLNEGMIGEALADGFSRDRIVWMPNPVDVGVFRPARFGEAAEWRARYGIPPSAPVAIYVGRLSQEKGLAELLRGFAAAVQNAPSAVLLIVGDGPLRPDLEALCRDLHLGPEHVRFAGRVPSGEIPFWLRASDVYVLTSPNEGFPCALLEAMSAGLPSVVSAIPANLQLVDDGIHGLTVGWNAEKEIGAALVRLFGDPELRERMGQAARARVVENYSMDRVLERYERLFEDLTK